MTANPPALPLEEWRATRDTLHMWTQIVGKIRMSLTPLINHWWNVPLYVSARGLTTAAIPYGDASFDMEFDFAAHVLRVRWERGEERLIQLAPRSVADFHREVLSVMRDLGITAEIWTMPVEVANPVRFELDTAHASYDREYVERFRRVLAWTADVLTRFRADFIGKSSPVHFFWGSFDLAVTRFSGRPAPFRTELDAINREAYSHEVSSIGWWPGDERLESASFYTYAAPEPAGFRSVKLAPAEAYYHEKLGGFYLPHSAVVTADDPARMVLDFGRTGYEAAATLGNWDRANLERRQ